ncbi:MAG TPA: amidohydrolase family protein [Candidatus Binatia bacterium]|nr:amidohydrolase family protein [Candidatus Binatia bacterium]
MSKGYVDADGHVMENAEDILQFVRAPFNNRGSRNWIPSLDHFHTPSDGTPRTPGTFDPNTGPEEWLRFLDRTGTEYTVLYPTTGLAYGNVAYPQWAMAYAQGYNDYIHARYLKRSSCFQAVALIPMQGVADAVTELRRAVNDLGFLGAMIPSNGLARHVSHAEYWPIYAEAERLGCVMAVHGGSYINLGFNTYSVFPATRALGMPFPLAIALTGMIVDGVLDQFPTLRVGFMEGGTAWIPLVLDRLERELEYGGLRLKRHPTEYFADDRLFVGCEGNEKALAYAIERVGPNPFMFASDFPHEISIDNCMEEIDEILERKDLQSDHKAAILGDNARRFYRR